MEFTTYFKAFLGLAIVLGLILGLSWVLKRFGLGDSLKGPLGRRRRIATVEAIMLDGRHRAVLLRRDDVEHLVLVGPNTSQVIERGIPVQETPPVPPAATDAPPTDATPATRFSNWMKP